MDEANEAGDFTEPIPREAKKSKNAEWKAVHEQIYSVHGFQWPPEVDEFLRLGFLTREAEIIWLANRLFPEQGEGWQWFDTNHTAQWTFRSQDRFGF